MIFDAHIHSTFSDGKLEVSQIVEIAKRKGIRVGIADHVGSTYSLNSQKLILDYLDDLKKYPVKRSMELNINEDFPLNDEILRETDYIIGGVHYEGKTLVGIEGITTDRPQLFIETVIELMLTAMEGRKMNILSHPTCLPNSLKHMSNELFTISRCDEIISTAIKNNIYLEINNLFQVPDTKFIDRALRAGARFSLGSDGHLPEAVCNLRHPEKMVYESGIPMERIFQEASE